MQFFFVLRIQIASAPFHYIFRVFAVCHDPASRFVKLITIHNPQGKDYLEESDFIPLVQVSL